MSRPHGVGTCSVSARSGPKPAGDWRDIRQLPDSEVRRLQMRGSAQLGRSYTRHGGRRRRVAVPMASAGRDLAGSLRSGPLRIGRHRVGSQLPSFSWSAAGNSCSGTSPPSPTFLTTRAGHGRSSRSGSADGATRDSAPRQRRPPPSHCWAGSGSSFLGAMSRAAQVHAPRAAAGRRDGRVGGWRAAPVRCRPGSWHSWRIVAIPLPYDAIARGRWGGLLLWAVAPWLMLVLARRVDASRFDRPGAARASTVSSDSRASGSHWRS